MLVIFGACAGLCYSALWFFPALIVVGGSVTALWDLKLRQMVMQTRQRWRQRREARKATQNSEAPLHSSVEQGELITLPAMAARAKNSRKIRLQRRTAASASASEAGPSNPPASPRPSATPNTGVGRFAAPSNPPGHVITIRTGIMVIIGFFGQYSSPGLKDMR